MPFYFKNYSLVKVIYLLIRCYKTRFFLWKTHTQHSEKDNTQNVCIKESDTHPSFWQKPHLFYQPLHFYGKNLTPPLLFWKLGKLNTPPPIPYKRGDKTMLQLYQVKKVALTDWKIATTLSLQEADNFGCPGFDAFDFQLNFNAKYTNFVFKVIFPNYLHILSILGKKNLSFLASNLLIFVSNRFTMLHIFYTKLRSEDRTESCLWLGVNFHLKACLVLVV